MVDADIIHQSFLIDSYEKHIEILEARIAELEAIREDPDYKGSIARRYASHYLGKTFDDSWTQEQLQDYFIKLFRGAITEAIEVYRANEQNGLS